MIISSELWKLYIVLYDTFHIMSRTCEIDTIPADGLYIPFNISIETKVITDYVKICCPNEIAVTNIISRLRMVNIQTLKTPQTFYLR